MAIYHAVSFYQLLTCIVHSRQKFEERNVLVLGTNVLSALNNVRELESIFDNCVYIDIGFGLSNEQTYKNVVNNYFTEIFNENNIVIDEETEIYVGGAHFNFGLYLALNQIPFYFMEDACGMISNAKHLRKINENRIIHNVLEDNGLYDGDNSCIKGIVCNMKEQESGFTRDNLIHFDTLKELSNLDKAESKRILQIFTEIAQLVIPENTVVMLTQHYANLNMMSYERQALLYGLVFDYFLKDKNILLKKHPYDFMAYDVIYPRTEQIEQRFPSEFLPFIFNHAPEMIATISSTGIKSLKSVASEYMEFDFEFEEFFEPVHKAYFALEMMEKQKTIKKLYTVGVNIAMLQNMCRYSFDKTVNIQIVPLEATEELEKDSVVIVDRIEKSIFKEWDIEDIAQYFTEKCPAKEIFLLNSNRDYVFHKSKNKKVWNHIIPIEIEKKNLNEMRDFELYNDFEKETLYLFTKHKEIRKMAMEFEEERTLENLQIEIRTGGFSTPEQLQISVMEGIVDATERRLQHYINRCDELEKEIEKLRK